MLLLDRAEKDGDPRNWDFALAWGAGKSFLQATAFA